MPAAGLPDTSVPPCLTCRLNAPATAVPPLSLTTVLMTVNVGFFVFVIVQVLLSPTASVTVPSVAQSPVIVTVQSAGTALPLPSVSLTVCWPTATNCAPVVPPLPTLSAFVTPSILRSKRSPAEPPTTTLLTVRRGLSSLVIVQSVVELAITGNFAFPGSTSYVCPFTMQLIPTLVHSVAREPSESV